MNRTLSLLVGLVPAAFLSCQLLVAQATVVHSNDTLIGGQLIFYFDAANYDVVYLTMSNTGTANVPLHLQLFGFDCEELFNFRIVLPAGCIKVYDMRRFELAGGQRVDLAGVRGILTATPAQTGPGTAAVPYNHLSGTTVHANLARANSFGLNAVARPAVDASGAWLSDFSGVLDGVVRRFQRIQPNRLVHDSVFALNYLTDSRVIFFTFSDNYFPNAYFLSTATSALTSFAGTADCARLSLPDRTFSCLLDVTVEELLGGTASAFRQNPGWLEFRTSFAPDQNLIAIASQTLATFTVNRYLWAK